MITIEEKDGFCIHKSDTYKIQKVGTDEIYSQAWDLIPCHYEYAETDEVLKTATEERKPIKDQCELWRAEINEIEGRVG